MHEPSSVTPPRPPGAPTRTAGDLAALVSRTEGLQPWRRVFHAVSGLGIAAALVWLVPSRTVALTSLGAAVLIAFAIDLVRLSRPELNTLFFRAFALLASPREARGVASSTWYLLGALLAVAFFPLPAAVAGIVVLALADPAASYVGRRWGTLRFGDGSLEGTAVFVVVALCVLLPFWTLPEALAGTALATVVERMPWRLDDNLTVPVVTAAAITLVAAMAI